MGNGVVKFKNHQLPIRGFTLLELSLVILIISIVLLLILPNFSGLRQRLESEREIERISQTIKYLYTESQLRNEIITLLFDLDGNKFYALVGSEKDENYFIPERKLNLPLRIKDIVDSEGNRITQGIVYLNFYPTGYTQKTTIHFEDEKERFYTLFINPLTAKTHIEEGYLVEE